MSFLFKALLIAALSYVGELFFPWWIIVAAAFLGGALVPSRSINSFLSGFLGVGLLWLVYAWILDLRAESIISEQVAPLFQMEEPAFMILSTALLGAIVGGMAALSGGLFTKTFPKREQKYYR